MSSASPATNFPALVAAVAPLLTFDDYLKVYEKIGEEHGEYVEAVRLLEESRRVEEVRDTPAATRRSLELWEELAREAADLVVTSVSAVASLSSIIPSYVSTQAPPAGLPASDVARAAKERLEMAQWRLGEAKDNLIRDFTIAKSRLAKAQKRMRREAGGGSMEAVEAALRAALKAEAAGGAGGPLSPATQALREAVDAAATLAVTAMAVFAASAPACRLPELFGEKVKKWRSYSPRANVSATVS